MTRLAVARTPVAIPLLLALLAAALYVFASSRRDFWAPDEPDFAEHVREMVERRDYLIPYENGKPYSEKPILFYWAMAATTPLSGGDVAPWAIRLPSVAAGAFLVFAAAYLAGFGGGAREAVVAGAATAVAPVVFWQAQFLQIDAMFSALLVAILCTLVMIDVDPDRRGWVWLLHVLMPLAVLTKGPLALVLTGLAVLARALLLRSFEPIRKLKPIRAAVILVVLVVPWYVAAARSGGPEYTYDLIVNQNWNRFFHAFDHIKPWWYYLKNIWFDFFPFTALALLSIPLLRREGAFQRRPELGWCATFAATTFLFLSASGSKQGKYLLAAYPAAAVLLAAGVAAVESERGALLRFFRNFVVFVAFILLGAAAALWPVARAKAPQYAGLAPGVVVPLVVGSIGTAVVLRRRQGVAAGLLALSATVAAAQAAAAAVVFPVLDPLKTGKALYQRMRPLVSHGEPLAYYGSTYHCAAILELRRRTEHFKTEPDLAAWVERTPGGLVLTDESLARAWTRPELRRLRVIDSQPVGQDRALLLGR